MGTKQQQQQQEVQTEPRHGIVTSMMGTVDMLSCRFPLLLIDINEATFYGNTVDDTGKYWICCHVGNLFLSFCGNIIVATFYGNTVDNTEDNTRYAVM